MLTLSVGIVSPASTSRLSYLVNMYSSIFLSLALAVSALPTAHVRRDHDRGAVYYLSNDAQNNVVALNVARDGTLTDGTTTSTNGAGSNGINPMTGGLVAPDALFSQQALTVAGNVSSPWSSSLEAEHG